MERPSPLVIVIITFVENSTTGQVPALGNVPELPALNRRGSRFREGKGYARGDRAGQCRQLGRGPRTAVRWPDKGHQQRDAAYKIINPEVFYFI